MRSARLCVFLGAGLWLGACGRSEVATVPFGGDAVAVVRVEPRGRVDQTGPIEVELSEPVVDAARVGQPISGPLPLIFVPELPGNATWIATNTLRFVPSVPLAENTRYRLRVRSDLAGGSRKLVGTGPFEVHRQLFTLLEAEAALDPEAPTAVQVYLRFSHPVRSVDIADQISTLNESGASVPFRVLSSGSSTSMILSVAPSEPSESPSITVRLARTLAPERGGEPLGKRVVRRLVVGQPREFQPEAPSDPKESGPRVSFVRQGPTLIDDGDRKVGFVTAGVTSLDLTVTRIYDENVVHVLSELRAPSPSIPSSFARLAYSGGVTIGAASKGAVTTTTVSLSNLDSAGRPGLYLIEVADRDHKWLRDQRWWIASGLDLSLKETEGYQRVRVARLADGGPVEGAEVTFLSRTNAVLGKLRSDADGLAESSLAPPAHDPIALVIARRGSAFAYLPVASAPAAAPIAAVTGVASFEAYVYADRGVYRPGDTVLAAVILRDGNLRAPPRAVFDLQLVGPEGRVVRSHRTRAHITGGDIIPLALPAEVPGGAYELVVLEDGVRAGAASIRVQRPGVAEKSEIPSPIALPRPPEVVAGPKVVLRTERDRYAVGEVAKLTVDAPFAGRLRLTAEASRVVWSRTLEIPAGESTVELPISPNMLPSTYLVARLFREAGAAEPRAFGVLPINVDAVRSRFDVSVVLPDQARPGTRLPIRVKVDPPTLGARLMIFAVDARASAASVDPFARFTAPRPLLLTTHDLFSATTPIPRPPPRAEPPSPKQPELRPALASLPVGIVAIGRDGWGVAFVDLPSIDLELRVVAIAFSGDRVGAADGKVSVHAPVSVKASFPDRIVEGDRAQLVVQLSNHTEDAARLGARVSAHGALAMDGTAKKTAELAKGATGKLQFTVVARSVGTSSIAVNIKGSPLPQQVGLHLESSAPGGRAQGGVAGEVRFDGALELSFPAEVRVEGARARVAIGDSPLHSHLLAIERLGEAPHPSLALSVSRAFPFIYLSRFAEDGRAARLREGLDRVFFRQTADGGLTTWPSGRTRHAWFTVYAAAFAWEAARAGFEVDRDAFDRLLEHLDAILGGSAAGPWEDELDDETRAFAHYVLARAGRPRTDELIALSDRPEVSERPVLRTLVGGALMASRQVARGASLLRTELSLPDDAHLYGAYAGQPALNGTQGWQWSKAGAIALILGVLAEQMPAHPSVPTLVEALESSSRNGAWVTSVDDALALVAFAKLGARAGETRPFWGSLFLGDTLVKRFNSTRPLILELDAAAWAKAPIRVTTTGIGVARVGAVAEGYAKSATEVASTLKVERTYLDARGRPIPAEGVVVGAQVVVRVEVRAESAMRDVAVSDVLPGGMVVELAPLTTRDAAGEIASDAAQAAHVAADEGSVRFYTDLPDSKPRRFYYRARATFAGRYAAPAARATPLFAPTQSAASASGVFVVVRPES